MVDRYKEHCMLIDRLSIDHPSSIARCSSDVWPGYLGGFAECIKAAIIHTTSISTMAGQRRLRVSMMELELVRDISTTWPWQRCWMWSRGNRGQEEKDDGGLESGYVED